MNKKRLSVVMAGAMLATSVAPVLAAETTGTEIAYDQLATFKSDLLAKMANKDNKMSDFAIFKTVGNPFVSKEIQEELAANNAVGEFSSKLGIKITDKNGVVKLDTTYTTETAKGLETALDALTSGDKVEVYERETTAFGGQLLPGKGIAESSLPKVYGADDKVFDTLTTIQSNIAINNSKLVESSSITKDGSLLKVVTKKPESATSTGFETLYFKHTDNQIDGRLAYDAENNLIDVTKDSEVMKFHHFGELVDWKACAEEEKRVETLKETYVIGEKPADTTKETLKVSDLFDGIALTAKGTEIVAELDNARKAAKEENLGLNKALVRLTTIDKTASTKGVYKFSIEYFRNSDADKAEKTITVVSNNEKELTGLHKLIDSGDFQVGVVAGQNRYETAVNVAKQQLKTTVPTSVVLVNGESLVDGLSAAPLAAEKNAPLLLSQTDKLASATKEYLDGLYGDLSKADKASRTVYLVGGNSVLSSELVNEIKEMGLKVERLGGENRESTSVAVAKALTNTSNAFVVGAEGEADAMSISAVAAREKTPIIVSKMGGLSSNATDYLRENAIKDITIIGGTAVVSEKEEAKIDKALPGVKSTRIAGANRIETNNAIIKEYYSAIDKKAQGVVVVKDGIADKKDLVDALSAANYAAKAKAPIVLATTKVTDTQKNTLLKVKDTTTFNKLAQVGMGAERTVLESLAELLKIDNKYL